MSNELSETANHLVNIAHQNSERLLVLINDILDIDKIVSGQMRFNMVRENLNDLVKQAAEANKAYADRLNVSFSLSLPEQNPPVMADASRMVQVLTNLLSNAAKFSPEGGTVVISVLNDADKVRVLVRDSGAGISDEFKPRIFSKFSQADSSITRQKGGTGLGLYISKQLIEHMRGTIDFESKPGQGTTFWIELPRATALAA